MAKLILRYKKITFVYNSNQNMNIWYISHKNLDCIKYFDILMKFDEFTVCKKVVVSLKLRQLNICNRNLFYMLCLAQICLSIFFKIN